MELRYTQFLMKIILFVLCQSGTAEEEWRGGLEEPDQQETGSG